MTGMTGYDDYWKKFGGPLFVHIEYLKAIEGDQSSRMSAEEAAEFQQDYATPQWLMAAILYRLSGDITAKLVHP